LLNALPVHTLLLTGEFPRFDMGIVDLWTRCVIMLFVLEASPYRIN